ncbi:serine hydrolase [Seonamhaeicola sediminis]|uniref:Serine hydrolase n=1 Tax=Seonamhaeicola sediminis TaxID=2528206 RepID=A0A562YH93_9FLAO|nr:serine hydrolase [Seonamhaeicola sediminis]TWO34412.1 serine hydrolase [Seonamhaeicola sediminis]
MKRIILSFSLVITAIVNTFSQSDHKRNLYFPPLNSDTWEAININETGWDVSQLQPLIDYIEENSTKAFIILKDGKIVMEWYDSDTNAASNLPWYSAGKTLVAFTVGIAQDEGYLNIDNSSSDYLGKGWSNMTQNQESKITLKHHLTMTTGLDYTVMNKNCTLPRCLTYKNAPGSFWYYHNAGYTKTHNIVSGAVKQSFESYFNEKLRDKIGMQGEWKRLGYAKPFYSNARSMARFGLLNLNKGIWNNTPILNDPEYFSAMVNTSQNQNESYGYLWWLNGKDSFRLPALTKEFKGKLIPNAPDDLIAGLGKNDQKLYVVPSKNLVIVRMGDKAKKVRSGPSNFDNELWKKLNKLFVF